MKKFISFLAFISVSLFSCKTNDPEASKNNQKDIEKKPSNYYSDKYLGDCYQVQKGNYVKFENSNREITDVCLNSYSGNEKIWDHRFYIKAKEGRLVFSMKTKNKDLPQGVFKICQGIGNVPFSDKEAEEYFENLIIQKCVDGWFEPDNNGVTGSSDIWYLETGKIEISSKDNLKFTFNFLLDALPSFENKWKNIYGSFEVTLK